MRTAGRPTPPDAKTANRPAIRCAHRSGPALLVVGMATALALQACAPRPKTTHVALPVYAIDQAGAAKSCTASPLSPALVAGNESATTMTLANDGGWCAVAVHQDGPAPFTAGLLTKRPEHGKVFIHEVGDETRIDYTPEPRFGGNDSFVVQLVPGDAVIRAATVVSVAAEPPAAAPPPAPKTPAPKTPMKRLPKAPLKK